VPIPNDIQMGFCSTKHAGPPTPHENKKLMSGILRRKVASYFAAQNSEKAETAFRKGLNRQPTSDEQ
jgi:hypothetical protein